MSCCYAFMLPVGTPRNAMILSLAKIETSYMVQPLFCFMLTASFLKLLFTSGQSWYRYECVYTLGYLLNDCRYRPILIQLTKLLQFV